MIRITLVKKTLREIPVEALIEELRARRGVGTRGAEYHDVQTDKLIAAIRDGQRVIYGTDDRQDLFQLAFFVANLDTYGGNSGSPVFASDTNRVEGILVRGETDFEQTPAGCQISLVCPTSGCRGEDITRTTQFSSLVP